jgi:hypothetical protein
MFAELFTAMFLWGSQGSEALETAFLAANLYHEARGEPLEGQLCVAYVTIARANDGNTTFGGPTLRSVVFKENMREDGRLTAEFSWWEKPSKPRNHGAIAAAWMIARQAREVPPDSLCRLERVRYYKNSDVAGLGGSCWFQRNAIYVGSVGRHDFYRAHQTAFEWEQGMSRDCYRRAKPNSREVARVPRPRPPAIEKVLMGSIGSGPAT